VTVPGYSAPPGIGRSAGQPAETGQAAHATGHDPRDRYPGGRAGAEPGSAVGVLVQGGYVGNLVAGDQIVHGDLIFGPRPDETGSGAR
jgi:hypothetical protein